MMQKTLIPLVTVLFGGGLVGSAQTITSTYDGDYAGTVLSGQTNPCLSGAPTIVVNPNGETMTALLGSCGSRKSTATVAVVVGSRTITGSPSADGNLFILSSPVTITVSGSVTVTSGSPPTSTTCPNAICGTLSGGGTSLQGLTNSCVTGGTAPNPVLTCTIRFLTRDRTHRDAAGNLTPWDYTQFGFAVNDGQANYGFTVYPKFTEALGAPDTISISNPSPDPSIPLPPLGGRTFTLTAQYSLNRAETGTIDATLTDSTGRQVGSSNKSINVTRGSSSVQLQIDNANSFPASGTLTLKATLRTQAGPPTDSNLITYNIGGSDSITLTDVRPDPSAHLAGASTASFSGTINYTISNADGGTLLLQVFDSTGQAFGSQVKNVSIGTSSVSLSIPSVTLPPMGTITLKAALITIPFTTGKQQIVYTDGIVYTIDANLVPPNPNLPDRPTDSRFVLDSGSGLKTQCTSRTQGPLLITLPVPRVIGGIESVSTNVKLRIAVYHGAIGGASSTPQDRFRINGTNGTPDDQAKLFLTGPTGAWTVNTLLIPSSVVRFGTRNQGPVPGNPPTPGQNQIEIQVDPNSSGGTLPETWCSVIDWVELSFDAIAPVIFVHGNGQGDDGNGGAFWSGGVLGDRTQPRLQMRQNVIDSFLQAGFPVDTSISMFTNTTEQHGDLLGKIIPGIAAEFGARHIHLIAHSKGGLDTRDFMARTIPPNLGVLSFTTFSSPHQGSSGPDYQIDAKTGSVPYSDDSTHTFIASLAPEGPGTQSLRVAEVARFNLKNIPMMPREMTVDGVTAPVQYTNVVADANLDDSFTLFGNPTISFNETEGLPGQLPGMPDSTWASIVEQLYRILGTVAYTTIGSKAVILDDTGETIQVPIVKEAPTGSFQLNDFCVTWASGSYLKQTLGADVFTLKANHSTVAGPISAGIALDAIRKTQPLNKQ